MPAKVLIVDDDANFRKVLLTFFEAEGFEVLEANHGDEAIDILGKEKIELILIDILLPRKNGFKLAEEFLADPDISKIPLIMMSGFYKGFKHKQDAKNLYKAIDYLEKPFKLDDDLKPLLISSFPELYAASIPVVPVNIFEDEIDVVEVEDSPLANAMDSLSSIKNKDTFAPEAPVREKPKDLSAGVLKLENFSIEDIFPSLLFQLFQQKHSGELFVENTKTQIKKIIYLQEGIPVFIKSTQVSECLGNILVDERIISGVDRDKSLVMMKQTRKPQGKVLREMNVISLENLKYGLIKQLERKLYDIFTWEEIKFKFRNIPGKMPIPPRIYKPEYSFAYLIYQGIMEQLEMIPIKQFFKKNAMKTVEFIEKPPVPFMEDELFDDEMAFYTSLKQPKTVLEITKQHSDDRENILKQLIVFTCLGMIQLS